MTPCPNCRTELYEEWIGEGLEETRVIRESLPPHEPHTPERCLNVQLAKMKAERDEARLSAFDAELKADFDALHVMWKNVSGALCDASDIVVYERDYARSVRELTASRNAERARAERYKVVLEKVLAYKSAPFSLTHAAREALATSAFEEEKP
jgi:hypothetical protein